MLFFKFRIKFLFDCGDRLIPMMFLSIRVIRQNSAEEVGVPLILEKNYTCSTSLHFYYNIVSHEQYWNDSGHTGLPRKVNLNSLTRIFIFFLLYIGLDKLLVSEIY